VKAHSAFNIAATHSSLLLYCTISLPVNHVTSIDTRRGRSQRAYNAAQRSLSSLVTVTHCREVQWFNFLPLPLKPPAR